MSSWLVDWFLSCKIEATLDEVRRYRRTHLCLTDHEIRSLDNNMMRRIYNSRIIHLFLNKNRLMGFPRDFGFYGQNLISLTLAENKLTEIPASVGLLKSLKVLNISWNPLTSHDFPVALLELKNLRKLYANHTNIGVLPEEVGQLEELKLLGLRHNRIESIPPGVLKLPKLKWLTLSHNRIREVPLEIVEASSLIHFNLNFNRISQLPSNIWFQMQKLRYLFLKSNRLVLNTRTLKDLQKIPNLKKIDLSCNVVSFQDNPQHFVLTPDTKFPLEEVQEEAEVAVEAETEEIWRRDGGLSTESSHNGFFGRSTLTFSSQPQPATGMPTSVPQEKIPRRHASAPSQMHQREIFLKRCGESGHVSSGGAGTQETDTTQWTNNLRSSTSQPTDTTAEPGETLNYSSGRVSMEAGSTSDTKMPNPSLGSMPDSSSDITKLDNTEQPTQVRVNLEFEIDGESDTESGGGGNQEKCDGNPEMLPGLGPGEIELGVEEDEAGNVEDDDSYSWEHSIPTNELDLCDVDSDLSEIDEMPFDQPEAKYTLYSLLF